MTQLKLFFLGSPQLEVDDVGVECDSKKGLALLAYVAVTGQSHSRDTLSTLLWPDYDQSRARSYLRHALWSLKKAVGEEWLEVSREQVGLNPDTDIWLDATAFQQVATTSPESDIDDLARLGEAVALYRGDFLAGFTLPDAPEFDEWQFFQMEGLRQKLARALERLVWGHSQQGDYEIAIPHARRRVALDPLHEPAQRFLMQLYAEAGQQAAALRQYQECVRLLDEELGVEPEEETTTLYEAIKAKRVIKPLLKTSEQSRKPSLDYRDLQAKNAAESFVPASEPSLPSFLDGTLPAEADENIFVARQQEMERLDSLLDTALSGHKQVAFIIGEAGQGKTTLLQAFAQHARQTHPNLIVAGGNCNAYTGLGDPYLPFREILQLLTGDVEAQVMVGTLQRGQARRLWFMLPALVQVLLEQWPDLLDTFVPAQALVNRAAAYGAENPPWLVQLQTLAAKKATTPADFRTQQSALFEQCAKVLQKIATQTPLLLMLDDLQWVDPGSVSLLFHLGRRLTGHQILILGAYRSNEVAMDRDGELHPLTKIVHEFQRDFGEITLDLGQAEGQDFVNALLDSEPNRLGPFFKQVLYRQTGGHPLFTIELLRGMQERGDLFRADDGVWEAHLALNWNTLPARVEGAIGERISRLALPLRELLQVASVEGEEFTAEVVARVLNLEEREVVGCLSGELDKSHSLVQAIGIKRVDGKRLSRYRFRHILIQLYLYNLMDEVERVYQHESVGTALEGLYGEQVAEVAVQLARHFEEARMPEKAMIYLHLAGDQAYRAAALNEAARYYQMALSFWPEADETGRAELLRKLGECQWMTGRAEDALTTFKDAYGLFESSGNSQGAGAIQRLMGRVYWELGNRQESLRYYHLALSTLKQGPESIELAWAISSIAQMHMIANEYTEALDWGEQALSLSEQLAAEAVTVHALINLGASYLNSGQVEQGRTMLQDGVRRALNLNLPHDACRGQLNLGEGMASLDFYQEARATFEELHAYATRVHTSLYAGSSLVELAKLDWLTGRWQASLNRRQPILEWLERGQSQAYLEVIASILFGWQHNDLGQPEEAQRILVKTLPKVKSFNELQLIAPHLSQLIRALTALGLDAEARNVVCELLDALERNAYDNRFSPIPLLLLCHWLVEQPDLNLLDEIAAGLKKLEQNKAQDRNPAAAAALQEAEGMVKFLQETPIQAIIPFRRAATSWQALNRPYDQMRVLTQLGQVLKETDNNDEARIVFEQAINLSRMLAAQLEDTGLKTSFRNSPLVQETQNFLDLH